MRNVNYAQMNYRALVGAEPFIFTSYVNGRAIPDDLSIQRDKFRRLLNKVHAVALAAVLAEREESRNGQSESNGQSETGESESSGQSETDNDYRETFGESREETEARDREARAEYEGDRETGEATSTDEGKSAGSDRVTSSLRDYLQWSKFVRTVCERRNADGHALDDWGMRPPLDGLALITAGCPIAAVKDAVTLHFPLDARREVKVKDFDFVKFGVGDYLLKASNARVPAGSESRPVPTFLIGGKGTGKTTAAKALARAIEERDGAPCPFGMVSMTAGTSPSAFYGRPKIGGDGGVVESQFVTLYRDGGVFLFDEIDAADPNILLIVNAALANGHFANASTGETITRSDKFVAMAAGNTPGLGGGRDYTGRDRLDAATLDRFGAGRVRVNLDDSLETKLAMAIIGA